MSLSIDKFLGIHAQALPLRSKRAEVLASNLANVDTPNYKAKDVDFKAALGQAQASLSVTINATQQGHLSGANALAGGAELGYRIPLQPSLDGNTVDAQVEKGEFAENAVQYQASLHFLGGKVNELIRTLREE